MPLSAGVNYVVREMPREWPQLPDQKRVTCFSVSLQKLWIYRLLELRGRSVHTVRVNSWGRGNLTQRRIIDERAPSMKADHGRWPL